MLIEVLALFSLRFHRVQPYAQAYFLTSLDSGLLSLLVVSMFLFVCFRIYLAWATFAVWLYPGFFVVGV